LECPVAPEEGKPRVRCTRCHASSLSVLVGPKILNPIVSDWNCRSAGVDRAHHAVPFTLEEPVRRGAVIAIIVAALFGVRVYSEQVTDRAVGRTVGHIVR
jgi:hypothetical protein